MSSSIEDTKINEIRKIIPNFKSFNLYDFNVYDGNLKTNDQENSSFISYKDNKKFIIQVFAINSTGKSVCIMINDFNPFFYIKVDDDWRDSDKNEFIADLRKKMGNYYEDSIVDSKLIKRQKLNMFDNMKLHNFIKISFQNTASYNKAKKLFYIDTVNFGVFNRSLIIGPALLKSISSV